MNFIFDIQKFYTLAKSKDRRGKEKREKESEY